MKKRKSADVYALIKAAIGESVFLRRQNGRLTIISGEDAQRLRDSGMDAEVTEVYLKAPDSEAWEKLIGLCPPDVQDAIGEQLRKILRANPDFTLQAVKHLRRVAIDPSATPKDRRAAAQ